jgi:hypothetical protein
MMPTPLPICGVRELLHERSALRGIDDLRHVLARDVHDLGVEVLLNESLDLLEELTLGLAELEIHVVLPVEPASGPRLAPWLSGE